MHYLSFRKGESLLNVRVMTGLALFCALYVVLRSVTINLSPTLRISFSFLAMAASCYFYGLVPNLIMAFAADFLGFLVHPDGTYMPLFALGVMTSAVIYSLFFYRQKKIGVLRVILAKLVSTLLVNILINPLVLTMLYATPFWAQMGPRLIKNLACFPIEVILLYLTMQICIKIRQRYPAFSGQ